MLETTRDNRSQFGQALFFCFAYKLFFAKDADMRKIPKRGLQALYLGHDNDGAHKTAGILRSANI